MNKKKIIFIGGTAGSGKTSIARELRIDHRLGTGFIREIARTLLNKDDFPELYTYTFSGDNPVKTLLRQSTLLKPLILACIKRARDEGTSLIIEGTHLIPSLYEKEDYDHFFILNYKTINAKRLCDGTHTKRKLSENDCLGVKLIRNFLLEDANAKNVTIIDSDVEFEKILTNLRSVINDK